MNNNGIGPIPPAEYEARARAVREGLAERKLDALLVSNGPNLRYLTGFTGDNANLLISEAAGALLVTDPRYRIQAAREVSCAVEIAEGPVAVEVGEAIRRQGVTRIGFEPARITYEAYQGLVPRLPLHAEAVGAGGWIEGLRMVKSVAELALIRRAVGISSKAFEQVAAKVRAGMKESDLAAELEFRMRRLGAEKHSFETIGAAGERSALPHAQPTAGRLCEASLVVVDMGAFHQGYASDMTRMLFVGKPGPKVKRAYRAVLEAQLAAIDAVKAGRPTAAVDRAARRVLTGYGLERAFVHSTGHGLGLEIHEPPRLGRRDKKRLEAGMAVTIEPGVYLEGWGGIRIEDTVVVTKTGCEVLTPTSKELRVV
jgi:Xaa-Pro aminopeptidase